jgi:hypothetical protein
VIEGPASKKAAELPRRPRLHRLTRPACAVTRCRDLNGLKVQDQASRCQMDAFVDARIA